MTQYVTEFPLPAPDAAPGRALIALARRIYDALIELLWLAAAVGNSTFIQHYYDCRAARADRGAGAGAGPPGLARLRFPFTRNPGVGAPASCGLARGPARGNAPGSPRRS